MALVSRKSIRIFKTFIVSQTVHIIILVGSLVLLPLALFECHITMLPFAHFDILEGNYDLYNVEEVKQFTHFDDLPTLFDWLHDSVIQHLIYPGYRPNSLVGPIRLVQSRVDIDEEFCSDVNYDFTTCSDDLCDVFEKLSERCHPRFILGETEQRSTIPHNPSVCAVEDCKEYSFLDPVVSEVSNQFDTYSNQGFIVDLPSDATEAKQILDKLLENNWIQLPATRALQILWTVRNLWGGSYILSRVLVEFQGNDFLRVSVDITVTELVSLSQWWITLIFVFYFVILGLHLLRIVVEVGVKMDVFVHLSELADLTFQGLGLSFMLIAVGFAGELNGLEVDNNEVFDGFQYVRYKHLSLIFWGLSCWFYFLKLLKLASLVPQLEQVFKFLIVIFRAWPTLLLYFAGYIYTMSFWSFGLTYVFQGYNVRCDTVLESFIFLTTFRSFTAAEIEILQEQMFIPGLVIYILLFNSLRYLFSAFLLALLVDAIRKSASHELDQRTPHEEELTETIEDLKLGWDKMSTQILQQLDPDRGIEDSNLKNSRSMIVWLETQPNPYTLAAHMTHHIERRIVHDDIKDKLREGSSQIEDFSNPYDATKFLKSLFALESSLLSSNAGKRLRIIATYMEDYYSSNTDYAETILNFLIKSGCHIPVLIFGSKVLEKDHTAHLRQKYKEIAFTTSRDAVLKFATSTENILGVDPGDYGDGNDSSIKSDLSNASPIGWLLK